MAGDVRNWQNSLDAGNLNEFGQGNWPADTDDYPEGFIYDAFKPNVPQSPGPPGTYRRVRIGDATSVIGGGSPPFPVRVAGHKSLCCELYDGDGKFNISPDPGLDFMNVEMGKGNVPAGGPRDGRSRNGNTVYYVFSTYYDGSLGWPKDFGVLLDLHHPAGSGTLSHLAPVHLGCYAGRHFFDTWGGGASEFAWQSGFGFDETISTAVQVSQSGGVPVNLGQALSNPDKWYDHVIGIRFGPNLDGNSWYKYWLGVNGGPLVLKKAQTSARIGYVAPEDIYDTRFMIYTSRGGRGLRRMWYSMLYRTLTEADALALSPAGIPPGGGGIPPGGGGGGDTVKPIIVDSTVDGTGGGNAVIDLISSEDLDLNAVAGTGQLIVKKNGLVVATNSIAIPENRRIRAVIGTAVDDDDVILWEYQKA